MTSLELRPLSTGEILDQAFGLYRRHFATLAVIVVVVGAVPLMLELYVQAAGGVFAQPVIWLVAVTLKVVLSAIGTAAAVFVVSESYLGRTVTPGDALARAVPYIMRLVVVSILISLVVTLGLLFFIVPGLILLSGLLIAPQALVLEENRGAIEAMGRSWQLTKGSRRKMLGLIIVTAILVSIPSFAGVTVAAMLTPDLTSLTEMNLPMGWYVAMILGTVAQMLLYPLMYSVLTVAYYDLRVRKEGFDLDVLAQALETS